jgi:integrase
MARKRKQRRSPNTGAIRKVNGRYKAAYPNPAGGHWTRTFDTVAEAERWLDSFRERKQQRLALTGGQQLTGTWLQTWLNLRPAHLKPTTREDYAYKLGLWSALSAFPLVDLMPDLIDDAQHELEQTISAATVRQARGLLKRALQEAVRRRYMLSNPAEAERTSRPPTKAPTRLRAFQARVLCDAASGFYAAAWPLLICCGLRAGELCGLRRGDIDLDACVLHVRQGVSDLRGKAIVQDSLKTPASTREVPFPRAHAPALRVHLDRLMTRTRRGTRAGTWQEHGLVFPGRSGRPLNPTSLRHALRDVTDAARLPPVTTHELRHTCGGLLEALDAPEHIIAGILGHGPKKITRHYAPPSIETMRPWIERVWGAVFGEGWVRKMGEKS